VIIPTLGRQQYLSRTVADLQSQSYTNAEIIVVDQSVEPEVINRVAPAPSRLPIQYLRDRGSGAARARNIGILAAKGDILLFLDDDVEIPARISFLSTLALMRTPPSVGYAGGPSSFGPTGPTAEAKPLPPPGLSYTRSFVFPQVMPLSKQQVSSTT